MCWPWAVPSCPRLRRATAVFFYSSRRRHTRSLRDWRSDVCSSDLGSRARGVCWVVDDGRDSTDRDPPAIQALVGEGGVVAQSKDLRRMGAAGEGAEREGSARERCYDRSSHCWLLVPSIPGTPRTATSEPSPTIPQSTARPTEARRARRRLRAWA